MQQLPDDLLVRVFSYFNRQDVYTIAATCNSLRRFVFSLSIFKDMTVVLDSSSISTSTTSPQLNEGLKVQHVMNLFPNSNTFKVFVDESSGELPECYRCCWDSKLTNSSVIFNFKIFTVHGRVNTIFFDSLDHCTQNLEKLRLKRANGVDKSILPKIATLTKLRVLTLPETLIISDPLDISNILTHCSIVKLQLRFSSVNDPHFWATVATNTPPSKLSLLNNLLISSYGTTLNEDSDPDISDIVAHLPIKQLSFKGTLDYNCLKSFTPPPPAPLPAITHLNLPWPQMDYTEQIEHYITHCHPLVEIQLQARNDNLLELISKHHSEGLLILHLACTEDVTPDAIIRLLQKCKILYKLSIFFYDAHILDENLMSAITNLNHLKRMWLGTLSTAVVAPLTIVHDGLEYLNLQELSVKNVNVDCPLLKKFVPPLYIEDQENAYQLYARSYPNQFIVRVAEGKKLDCVKIRPHETVQQLINKIQHQLNKPNAVSVIVNGKALSKHLKCSECLRNGSLVKILS